MRRKRNGYQNPYAILFRKYRLNCVKVMARLLAEKVANAD